MVTLRLPDTVVEVMHHLEGETQEEKVLSLVASDLENRLRECAGESGEYELKHRTIFSEFAQSWREGKIPDRWSHDVERDYMVWEGLEGERGKWLSALRKLDELR